MRKIYFFLFIPIFIILPFSLALSCPYVDHSGYHTHYAYNPIYVESGDEDDVQWAFTSWMDAINSVGGPFYYYTVDNWDAPNKVRGAGLSVAASTTTARDNYYHTILYFTIEYNLGFSWCMGYLMPELDCPNGLPSFWAVMAHEAGHAVGFSDTTQACSCPGFVGSDGWLDAWPTMVGEDNGCVNGGFVQPYILLHTLSALDLDAVASNYAGVVLIDEPFEAANVRNGTLSVRMKSDGYNYYPAYIYGSENDTHPLQLGSGTFDIVREPEFVGYRVPLNGRRVRFVWYKMTSNNTFRGPFSVENGNQIPTVQPYTMSAVPNPFNPKTTIKYYIPSPDDVKLGVFDIQGKHIIDLYNGHREAGDFQAAWRGIDKKGQAVSAGTYIVKLETTKRINSQKITLIK